MAGGTTMLLLEGDTEFTYLMQRYARSCGCEVCGVVTIAEAAHAVPHLRPALLLFDLLAFSLPSAESVLTARRQLFGVCPIVVCAGREEEERAWALGADYCLLKPVLFADFQRMLHAVGSKWKPEVGSHTPESG